MGGRRDTRGLFNAGIRIMIKIKSKKNIMLLIKSVVDKMEIGATFTVKDFPIDSDSKYMSHAMQTLKRAGVSKELGLIRVSKKTAVMKFELLDHFTLNTTKEYEQPEPTVHFPFGLITEGWLSDLYMRPSVTLVGRVHLCQG